MKKKFNLTGVIIFVSVLVLITIGWTAENVLAATVTELKGQIAERNQQVKEIEREIKEYETQLIGIGAEKRTLQTSIKELDVSRQKIGANVKLTENKIYSTGLEISRLDIEIDEKESKISQNIETVAKTIRTIDQMESNSLIETVLAHDNLNEVWEQIDALGKFQLAMRENITQLTELKEDLGDKQEESETRKAELTGYRNQLSGQKRVLDENRREKDGLLTITKNKESNYQNLLVERKAAREQFERELLDLESQLEFIIDPSSIPPVGQGVLGWPLDTLTITQRFGSTSFAKSGAYDGRGHNGVDFRASSGTRVKAALSGRVVGAGNTDIIAGCYSYGNWILLEHNNGLATLYAHLSARSVSVGQTVKTSEVIGFSGNSGYSTGPHLHFSVYVNGAVQIVRLGDIKSITNCGPVRIPVAPLAAYLNPLDYLRGVE